MGEVQVDGATVSYVEGGPQYPLVPSQVCLRPDPDFCAYITQHRYNLSLQPD